MQLSMHKNVQYDSVKCEIEQSMLLLKEYLRFHCREHLKLHKKLMVDLSKQLRVCLRVH